MTATVATPAVIYSDGTDASGAPVRTVVVGNGAGAIFYGRPVITHNVTTDAVTLTDAYPAGYRGTTDRAPRAVTLDGAARSAWLALTDADRVALTDALASAPVDAVVVLRLASDPLTAILARARALASA
jgi:hypothetical protein